MIKLSKLENYGLAAAIVVNLALVTTCYLVLREEARLYMQGQQFPVLSGVALDGATWHARDAPCYVIRITSDACPFCQADKPAYSEFLGAARDAGCDIVEVAPRAGQMAAVPREAVVQLKFVDMEFGDTLSPFATPQTIVLSADRIMLWSRPGTFDDRSLADGIAVLRKVEDLRVGR